MVHMTLKLVGTSFDKLMYTSLTIYIVRITIKSERTSFENWCKQLWKLHPRHIQWCRRELAIRAVVYESRNWL